jgi:hydrogenase/urease accessory protein HupE
MSFGISADELMPALLEIRSVSPNTYNVLLKTPVFSQNEEPSLGVKFDSSINILSQPEKSYVEGFTLSYWNIYHPQDIKGKLFTITGLESTNLEVFYRVYVQGQKQVVGRLTPESPTFSIDQSIGKLATIKTYALLGFEHILNGIDHLLFVACIVLVASNVTKLFWAITGFTLAHSLTLFLSALNIVKLPIPPIEAIIALSIIFLASEIAKQNQASLTYRYPVAVSSSFGLLHGFGFASALMEIGLPETDLPLALLFFNVGVEVGQLVFVAALILTIRIVSSFNQKNKNKWHLPVSYFIGSVATMWLIERVILF